MQDALFDHVFTVCRDNDMESTLQTYRTAGMQIDPDITKHGYGNFSGFALMTGTYLEFLTFYDRSLWKSDPDTLAMVNAHRPYGIALRCESADKIYRAVSAEFTQSPTPYSAGRKDSPDTRPIWNFFKFPAESLPGIYCFAVEYLRLGTERSKLARRQGANGAFFMGGLVFCSPTEQDCAKRCDRWLETLAKIGSAKKLSSNRLLFGHQELEWISTDEYRRRFQSDWISVDSKYSELAALKLLSANLDDSHAHFKKLGHPVHEGITPQGETRLYVPPHPNTGFAFQIEEGNMDKLYSELTKSKAFTNPET